jgi:hypothetical protein
MQKTRTTVIYNNNNNDRLSTICTRSAFATFCLNFKVRFNILQKNEWNLSRQESASNLQSEPVEETGKERTQYNAEPCTPR